MFTVIDSDNYAAAGIETMFFPGGEPHVKTDIKANNVLLVLKLRTWNDVGFGALVLDALCNNAFAFAGLQVFIPYFPGARQDRPSQGTGATLDLMKALFLREITPYVLDAHSRMLTKDLKTVQALMPADLQVPIKDDVVGIIAPDDGATARACSFRDRFYPQVPVVQCHKKRNPDTGELSGYQIADDLSGGGRYIIVDDICDGGGTFGLLAEAWYRAPYSAGSRLELFVTHGIFSRGLGALHPKIEHVTTTDSWCQMPSSDFLTVLPIAPLYPKIMGEKSA